jgi:8-amino-3,8-dideoxy-alpha-D-manno-octulosonate transaminase
MKKWPACFPGAHWYGDDEARAALDVVRRRTPFRYYGLSKPKYAERLEAQARRFYDVRHALAVNSGTGALFTAVRALGIGPGDEVIVPAFLWVSTIGAVVAANAIPVLCEVDDSFTMDPADLARKITRRTRLIVSVHMSGAPCDMRRILAIANRDGIPVLEDCAQANGGTFAGRKLGTFGRVGMFSLQVNKNCTSGEGGILVTDDDALAARLQAAHDVGVPWVNGGPDAASSAVTWGEGRRMGELVASIATVQMRRLPAIVRTMRASKSRIKSRLEGVPGLSFRRLNDPRGDTGNFLVLLLADAATAREAVRRMRAAGLGGVDRIADFGMHIYSNIPQLVRRVPLSRAGNPWRLPANRGLVRNYSRGACPASDALFGRSVIVAIPSRLTRAQEAWAAQTIRRAVSD